MWTSAILTLSVMFLLCFFQVIQCPPHFRVSNAGLLQPPIIKCFQAMNMTQCILTLSNQIFPAQVAQSAGANPSQMVQRARPVSAPRPVSGIAGVAAVGTDSGHAAPRPTSLPPANSLSDHISLGVPMLFFHSSPHSVLILRTCSSQELSSSQRRMSRLSTSSTW